ncbi:galactose-specific lectin nattectin-like [Astyanax mexicanus]|uniref:Galactose-specific lectin nattectin-like n=1 Tax=Astyanax mexicanus TaxID=7994 RepID=A0A8T2LSF9_ASTMX|nr:galactose-specific lectin nattectin-like [Astyanax mexicanus]
MGRFAELSLLFVCFVAFAASENHPEADLVIKPVTEDDLNALVKDQIKNKVKRAATCDSNCPFGWVKYGERCFTYVSQYRDWTSAEAYCVSQGANLASIHTELENMFVKALVRAYDPIGNPTWIGLSACQKPYTWFWSDGTKYDYSKWNSNEPNRFNDECCVQINWLDVHTRNKEWNDNLCSGALASVCVKRLA